VQPGRPVVIGRPIANTQFYILDQNLQPTPIGVPGELYIGGAGLARGYHRRPELTAEKFIANPFRQEAGERLYKTGDLCRYLADGNVEYLSRLDHQVKIRGFRIELGEIETKLSTHPAVKEAVVVAREDSPGDKRLVAYFTLQNGEPVPGAELRQMLQAKLPEYMIPAAFVQLERFPLTPNGKVDRKSLPEPGSGETKTDLHEPRKPSEIVLATIWCKTLKLKRIGIHDNFFDLGGSSLQAVNTIGEINRALRINLRVQALFQYPTIEKLAENLPKKVETKPEPTVYLLGKGQSELPVIFITPGLWEDYWEVSLAWLLKDRYSVFISNVPLCQKSVHEAALNPSAPFPSLENMAAAHADLIRKKLTSNRCILTGYCFGGILAFEVAQHLIQQGIEVEKVVLLDTWLLPPKLSWRTAVWLRRQFRRAKDGRFGYHRLRNLFRTSSHGPKANAASQETDSSQPWPTVPPEDDNFEEPGFFLPWKISGQLVMRLLKAYVSRPLASRGVLIRSMEADKTFDRFDETRGAKKLFTQGVTLVDVPGAHHTMFQQPRLQILAEKFAETLGESEKAVMGEALTKTS
jgi:thioesterase domain-containing protein/acyl carrier protein